jgi:Secretion system C-terminal sorting domain
MNFRLFTLVIVYMFLNTGAWASKLFIPMDATSQTNHLKAYGIAFVAMQRGIKVDWLLNYKGGSFAMETDADIAQMCKSRGVSFQKLTNKQYTAIVSSVKSPTFNGQVVTLEKAPKIAVYTPTNKEPWDDAVTMALTYAEIPFDKLYADEVLAGGLDKYDWLHLHHEDFTGQYGKFYAQFKNAEWYKNDKAAMEAMAAKNGFKKVSQMQLAVVKKIKAFVNDGGNMFAMCSATQTFDIALAAEGTDICDEVIDGDGVDPEAQSKLDFTKCLAFRDFRVSMNPWEYRHSDIDITPSSARMAGLDYSYSTAPGGKVIATRDMFTLYSAPAKFDQVPAMLCQNHVTAVKGFMGQTTAFRKEVLKPGVQVLADFPQCNEARYIHGELGKGSWTFLGGHDPEAYRHAVNDPATDLSKYPNSPGYRLILNNVLFPAVKKTEVPTVVINSTATPVNEKTTMPGGVGTVVNTKKISIFPNPTDNELVITLSEGMIETVSVQNLSGQELINRTFNSAKVNVSMKDLASGMYLIKVNGDFAGKIVKE